MILPKENNSCFLYHQTTFPTTNFHCISLLWKMNYSNSLHISFIIILTYQGFTSLCYLLLFPYSNCQDCFLLWNVLHMQMLKLARLGTSPLSTTGEKKLPAMMNQKTFMLLLILTFHVQVKLITDFFSLITVLDELYDF